MSFKPTGISAQSTFLLRSRRTRTARLAEALLADRTRELAPSKSTLATCQACGRSAVDSGDRCCSPRCEAWLAAGNVPVDPGFAGKALELPIRNWIVVAGQPRGDRPYASLLDAIAVKRTKKVGRPAPRKNGAQTQQIEGADHRRSPLSARASREPLSSLRGIHGPVGVISVELGAIKARGADGMIFPEQEWTRRASLDGVVTYVAGRRR